MQLLHGEIGKVGLIVREREREIGWRLGTTLTGGSHQSVGKKKKKKREREVVRGVAGLQLGCCPGLAQKAALLSFFVLLPFSNFLNWFL
jgi:hypothetical protein